MHSTTDAASTQARHNKQPASRRFEQSQSREHRESFNLRLHVGHAVESAHALNQRRAQELPTQHGSSSTNHISTASTAPIREQHSRGSKHARDQSSRSITRHESSAGGRGDVASKRAEAVRRPPKPVTRVEQRQSDAAARTWQWVRIGRSPDLRDMPACHTHIQNNQRKALKTRKSTPKRGRARNGECLESADNHEGVRTFSNASIASSAARSPMA